jgi:DNA-binding NarL/FixJ family response regulator
MSAPISIHLVEDNPSTLDLWTRRFRRDKSFELLGAHADAETALPAVLARPPRVILVDWKLPGMDGIEFIWRVKVVLPEVLSVLVTVEDLDELPLHTLSCGVDACIPKPSDSSELIPLLKSVLAGQCVYSNRIIGRLRQLWAQQLPPPAGSHGLAPHELKVVQLLCSGLSAKQAAEILGLSEETVCTYRKRAYDKLGAHKLAEAANKLRGSDSSRL